MIYKFNKETIEYNFILKGVKQQQFYTGWYIDLPEYIAAGGHKGSLAMVAGADDFLDILLGDDPSNTVVLDLQLEPQFKTESDYVTLVKVPVKKLKRYVTGGADYILPVYDGKNINHKMWLCNVTKYVFGFFPNEIYFKHIK